MKSESRYHIDRKAFSTWKIESTALLRFKDKFLLRSTDLSTRDEILEYLDFLTQCPDIKVLIVIGSPEKSGCQEYVEFYHHVMASDLGIDAIHRMYNVINQLILKIVDLNQIVIHCNSGKVISSFLNISLACDYRIVGENTLFQNPCLKLGLLPKGGGAFFLPSIVGLGRSYDILLSEEDLPARKALEMGIVDMVVDSASLEEAAIEKARQFARKPRTSLSGVKRLLGYSRRSLEDYLRFENEELIKVIMSSDEWRTAYAV